MAGKSSNRASSKSTSKDSKPTSKVKPAASSKAARKVPSKRSKSTPSRTNPSSKPPSDKKSSSNQTHTKQPVQKKHDGLSTDRKLDILGVGMAFAGILTLLSLLSPVNGTLTGTWVKLIGQGFGWGMYVLPIGLLVGGLWLILRKFERIPSLGFERLIGILLLFLILLASIHFIQEILTKIPSLQLAGQGLGGGYLGGLVSLGLQAGLGKGGAAVALLALLLISLAFTLEISIYEMGDWLGKGFLKFKNWLSHTWQSRSQPVHPASNQLAPEFTPLPRVPINHQVETPVRPASTFSPQVSNPARPWVLPPIEQILDSGQRTQHDEALDHERATLIEETLKSFGAPVKVVEINRGPTITQFGVEPDFIETRNGRMRVRVSKIVSLADDLALALSARTVRIQAPVPGKGFVGLEVPNEHINPVMLRDVLESEAFRRLDSPLRFALGKNVAGQAIAYDLASMPHLLIAGATGSGKSVCVNALICCFLMNNTPDDLRLIMVDPKRVELSGYNGIPHLLAPVVVELEKVVSVLQWVTREMDMRYRKLSEAGARNIVEYNLRQPPDRRLPYLVVIIDELADLMMLAPDETERTIARLAQMARATGIHLVIATQRPSVEVVTGLIKANFPARIAFAVAANVDSRVILDQPGAERLLGRGDMLFQAPDAPAPIRLQGVFVSDQEIFQLVSYWQAFSGFQSSEPATQTIAVDAVPSDIPLKQLTIWDDIEADSEDPLLKEAIDLSRRQGRASVSMLQRRLRIGYTRAARLVERMEEKGIVGPPDPSTGTREILDYGEAAPPADEQDD